MNVCKLLRLHELENRVHCGAIYRVLFVGQLSSPAFQSRAHKPQDDDVLCFFGVLRRQGDTTAHAALVRLDVEHETL